MPTRQGPFEYTDQAVTAIEKSLSPERLARYISAAQGNKKRAIQLYERNTALSEALYGVIQGLEIALRNALHNTLRKELGRDDWYDHAGLEEKDVRIFTGMFRQIEWYAKEGWKVVEEKEKKGIKIR